MIVVKNLSRVPQNACGTEPHRNLGIDEGIGACEMQQRGTLRRRTEFCFESVKGCRFISASNHSLLISLKRAYTQIILKSNFERI
jgi:hypothetical protein